MRIVLIASWLAFGLIAGAHDLKDSEDSPEYRMKAEFIYNFAKLVEWPGGALAQRGHEILIGVLGNDSFAAIIERVVADKRVDGRPFVVKRLRNKDYRDCSYHILFIAATEQEHADEIIGLQKKEAVLTIAETPGFTKRGGMIDFTVEDGKVHFEVNVEAAKQSGLNISSRLLSLARIVQTSEASR